MPPVANSPVINEEADRVLGRIIVRHFGATFVLLILATFVMAFVNVPGPFYAERRFLDTVSVLIVLTPFFIGINKLFAARLSLGRELTARRAWREAVAALDPFAGPTQRFLDSTGEAHYLLALAYDGLGESEKAAAARQFLRRHRPGIWAGKLDETPVKKPKKRR